MIPMRHDDPDTQEQIPRRIPREENQLDSIYQVTSKRPHVRSPGNGATSELRMENRSRRRPVRTVTRQRYARTTANFVNR